MTFEKLKEDFHDYIQNNEFVSNKKTEIFLSENLDLLESWYNFEESFKNKKDLFIDKEYSFHDIEKKLGRKFEINVNLDTCSFKFFNSYPSELSRNIKILEILASKANINRTQNLNLIEAFSLKNEDEFNDLSEENQKIKKHIALRSYLHNKSNSSFRFWDGRLEVDFNIHDALENKTKPFFAISVQDQNGNNSEFLSEFFYKYFQPILNNNRESLQQKLIILNIIQEMTQSVCFQKEDLMDSIPTGSISIEDFINFVSDYNEIFTLENDCTLIEESLILDLKTASKEFISYNKVLKNNAINSNI